MFRVWLGLTVRFFRSRRALLIENLALRQQLTVLKRKHPRPKLTATDRLFWLVARHLWSSWKEALILVSPETVVRWHRAGFRWYWSLLSKVRKTAGRKPVSKHVRELIFKMLAENPSWGAPRILGELLMLGFNVSERTVSRWMKRAPRDTQRAQHWRAFLHNHREVIAAMDFFAVPTVTFGLLYCFFIIAHDRRRILHFNVTRHPTSVWTAQQLRDAFPFTDVPRFIVFDHDAKYGFEVSATIRSMSIVPLRSSIRCPWQNGVAERWVGSCRRELLDHVIAFNERHLKRLLSQYVSYYHDDRTHLALGKQTPGQRNPSMGSGRVVRHPRLGGLHHRYDRVA
jgi:transposase InsO family protein